MSGNGLLNGARRLRASGGRLIRSALCHSGVSARFAKRHRSNIVIMHHGVEPWLADHFESQLRYLVKHFKVVPLDEIVLHATGGPSPRTGLVALTFDDGLRNNYTVVYPKLQKLELPATFFVCPGLVGNLRSVWTYEMRSRLRRFKPRDRERLCQRLGIHSNDDPSAIVPWMKTIPLQHREQVESEIRALTPDFAFTEDEHERFDLMGWDDLGSLDPAVVTIGSHGLTHADLTQVDVARLEKELYASREQLEARLGRAVHHFAYPNGSFDGTVRSFACRFYRSAVTVNCGGVGLGDDVFALKRINNDFDLPTFAWRLAQHAGRNH